MKSVEIGDKKPAEKPVSLAPLKFEDAVAALFAVKPEPKSESDKSV